MVKKPNGTEDDRIESNPVQDQPTVNDMDVWCLTSIQIDDRARIAFSYSDKKKENGVGGATEPLKLDAIAVYNSSNNPVKTCECYYRANNTHPEIRMIRTALVSRSWIESYYREKALTGCSTTTTV